MAWKGDAGAIFSGASGQAAVIGELLHRKCNAAIPHVDVGTDVFAFRDDREEVARIQVKSAPGESYKKEPGYHARFGIPMKQLGRTDVPPLFYALAVRLDGGWGDFIVLSRAALNELWGRGCGKENNASGDLELYVQFRPEQKKEDGVASLKVTCGEFNLTEYVNAWESLPPLMPPVEIDSDHT
jgi:hypothetical protein